MLVFSFSYWTWSRGEHLCDLWWIFSFHITQLHVGFFLFCYSIWCYGEHFCDKWWISWFQTAQLHVGFLLFVIQHDVVENTFVVCDVSPGFLLLTSILVFCFLLFDKQIDRVKMKKFEKVWLVFTFCKADVVAVSLLNLLDLN